MKNTLNRCTAFILLTLFALTHSLQAQIPNDIFNNNSSMDTAGIGRVLGAFAKAAAANQNDTSSADLTMKALSLLTEGKSISPADSAAAIKGYMKASGGTGIHYEYIVTMSGNKTTTRDSSQIYFTNNGEGRVEMRIPIPGVRINRMIGIGHIEYPAYTMFLYPDSKTYSLHIIDTAMISGGENYQVTRIGTELINGYPCVRSKLVSTRGSGRFKTSSVMDIWTSTSVPGYSLYKKMISLQTSNYGMMKALDKAGGAGVIVKLTVTGRDYTMEENLVKTEEKSFPANIFLIPPDYAQSKGGLIYQIVPSSDK
jgi:hypothetical protein